MINIDRAGQNNGHEIIVAGLDDVTDRPLEVLAG